MLLLLFRRALKPSKNKNEKGNLRVYTAHIWWKSQNGVFISTKILSIKLNEKIKPGVNKFSWVHLALKRRFLALKFGQLIASLDTMISYPNKYICDCQLHRFVSPLYFRPSYLNETDTTSKFVSSISTLRVNIVSLPSVEVICV